MTQIQTNAWFTNAANAKAFFMEIAPRPRDFNISHVRITGHWVSWEPDAVAEAHGLTRHVYDMTRTAESFGPVKVEMPGMAGIL